MRRLRNLVVSALIAIGVADVVLGLDTEILTIASTIITVLAGVVFVAIALIAVGGLGVIFVRDAVDEIREDRANNRPWLWRCVLWIGVSGLLVDGTIGAWNAFREHVLFSTGVSEIPFAGVPLMIVAASIPLRWIEQFLLRRRSDPRRLRDFSSKFG